mgnify:FL=1
MRDSSQVLDDLLRVFRLSSTRFSRNQDTLVLSLVHQVSESFIGHSIYMGFGFFAALSFVHVDILICVNCQRTVRIYRDQK